VKVSRTLFISLAILLIACGQSRAKCPNGYHEQAGKCVPGPARRPSASGSFGSSTPGHAWHHHASPDAFGNASNHNSSFATGSPNSAAPQPHGRGSPSHAKPPAAASHPPDGAATHRHILETGYGVLPAIGGEELGYGLYSYAILSPNPQRSSAFLSDVFRSTPPVADTASRRSETNILYLPLRQDMQQSYESLPPTERSNPSRLGSRFAKSLYDFKMARAILDHLCKRSARAMRALCAGDLSRGPYIFTYAAPASRLATVPPPYLFVDLSPIDPRGFPELLSAFRAQVKRRDVSDGARINSLRLKILRIALSAADVVKPAEVAMQDIMGSIVHMASAQAELGSGNENHQ
jgi:hypothetical protein